MRRKQEATEEVTEEEAEAEEAEKTVEDTEAEETTKTDEKAVKMEAAYILKTELTCAPATSTSPVISLVSTLARFPHPLRLCPHMRQPG